MTMQADYSRRGIRVSFDLSDLPIEDRRAIFCELYREMVTAAQEASGAAMPSGAFMAELDSMYIAWNRPA